MTPDIIVGIDNGISGALVAISAHHGLVIDKMLMPTRPSGKSRECNGAEIVEWLHGFSFNRIAVCLETPSKHSPGLLALCSMWDCYGAIRGVLESCGIQHARIAPQTWQSALLGKVPKGGTKTAARAKAAHYSGVHLTGCELDPDYFAASIKRVIDNTAQLTFDL
jgi:hypothetical protein